MNKHFNKLFTQQGRQTLLKSRRLDGFYRKVGYRILHCLGDSHIAMFRYLDQNGYLRKTRIRCRPVSAASAMGLVHPLSKTQALPTFRQYIAKVPFEDYLLFLLGEVDCGFVIWYRAAKHSLPVETQFEQSLHNYESFICSVKEGGHQKLIIASAPLPTIFDDQLTGQLGGQARGQVAVIRQEVTASLLERTELTRRYNARLSRFCQEQKIIFLDYENELLDEATKVIDRRFLNPDPLDHHMNPEPVAPLLTDKFHQLGFA